MQSKTPRKRVVYRAPQRSSLSVSSSKKMAAKSSGSGSTSTAVAVYQQNRVPLWLRDAGIGSWSIIGVVIVIAGIVFATARISAVFIAVFVALVFTSVLNPVVNSLSKHMRRGFSVVIAVLGGFLVFVGLIGFVITSVAGQWRSLVNQLTHGLDKITDFLDATPFNISLTSDQVYNWIQENIQKGQTYISENWQTLVSKVMSNAGGIAIFFTIVGLAIFITIFFLLSGSQMWRWFLNLLPTERRGTWNHAAQAGWHSFSGYARGTMIIALIDGGLAWIFLAILKVPLAPALGVLVMIGALIPLIGAPAAMVVAMIVALATDGVWTAIIVGIGIALIGQLEGHVLQPLIMGRQVSLHPVVVGIGVIAGTLLAGLLGAIVAIPLIGVVWAVFNALYHRDPPIVGPLPDSDPPPGPIKPEPGRIGRFFQRLFGDLKHKKQEIDAAKAASDEAAGAEDDKPDGNDTPTEDTKPSEDAASTEGSPQAGNPAPAS